MADSNQKHVFFSRDLSNNDPLVSKLSQHDIVATGIPLINCTLYDDPAVTQMLTNLASFDWIIFTSGNGVKYFFETLKVFDKDIVIPPKLKIGVVGEKTASALYTYGVSVDFIPDVFDAEHMGEQFLNQYQPNNVLLVKGKQSRNVLDRLFNERAVNFERLIVYETITNLAKKSHVQSIVEEDSIDAYSFTSPSSIRAMLEMINNHQVETVIEKPCFSIGETTASYAKEVGFKKTLIPNQYTLDSLVERVIQYYKED
ncbi:uroporphyrinogen-III synthase [Alkalibacillus aidingensis]|uniref:uroporphyrinogen-III synthase n=1 Tax=Alkalibacillus aidingensis TaxID=2747607 RepID=UPI001660A76C|nr:uroporphyrinogen-III synthase [Alkalibacillus aidingensis]